MASKLPKITQVGVLGGFGWWVGLFFTLLNTLENITTVIFKATQEVLNSYSVIKKIEKHS